MNPNTGEIVFCSAAEAAMRKLVPVDVNDITAKEMLDRRVVADPNGTPLGRQLATLKRAGRKMKIVKHRLAHA